ncbi:sulfatase [Limnoglobus roseus]|uniref:Sulfatase n=1 Tax=Limnoglobus roseus TaxID=2598579 RepID=A0A5C1A9B8_9BACT|nr:sulfatase [Limnoglobus roseus]QEL13704.1 sulfatase [Limnoglobus roseus]
MLARLLSALFVLTLVPAAFAAEKPNVVFILADDLGINDLACYGRAEHRTPNLDTLAKDGVRFTTAYAACPVCSPTRAAILTGKHPARLHLTTFLPGRADAPSQKLLHPKIRLQLPLEEKTLAEYLKAAGYATAAVGKWHLGFTPDKQGFDVAFDAKESPTAKAQEELTAKAEEFLTANRDRPFFLYLAHHTPHIPLAAKPELVEKYKATFNPTYAAMIEEMDASVGRVLAKLDALKLTEKTLVVFTSDNGGLHVPELKDDPPTHSTPYRAGKGFLYEGGIRVPLIVRWPGVVKPGSVCNDAAISTDWTPTLLTVCGVTPDGPLDGVSLLPQLKGEKAAERTLFWHVPHYTNQGSRPGGAVRRGDRKLIVNYEDGSNELYNVTADPGETNNQAALRKQQTQELRTLFDTWLKSLDAQTNLPNPNFDAALHKTLYADVDVSKLKPETTAAETAKSYREWRKAIDAAVKK